MRWLRSSVSVWFVIIVILAALAWVYGQSRNDSPGSLGSAIASLIALPEPPTQHLGLGPEEIECLQSGGVWASADPFEHEQGIFLAVFNPPTCWPRDR